MGCPSPDLCDLMGRHLHGHLWHLWNTRPDYRRLWCDRAGVELAQAQRIANPTGSRAETDCVHRGEVVDEVECPSCRGSVRLKVQACELHGRCTQSAKRVDGVRSCVGCGDKRSDANPSTFAVGITTAPRPVATLARATASIVRAGFSPTVYAEPGSPELDGLGVPVVVRRERLGCWRNWLQTLRDLLRDNPDAGTIVIFQDDVVLCRNVRELLERDLWPSQKAGVVSLYCPNLRQYERGERRVKRVNQSNMISACSLVFPRHVAERIAADPKADRWKGTSSNVVAAPVKKKCVDLFVGTAVKRYGLGAYFYEPSLGQHFADTSSIGHGGREQLRSGQKYRLSKSFVGEDADALEEHPPAWVRWNADGTQRFAEPEKSTAGHTVHAVIPVHGEPDRMRKCLDALAASRGDYRLHVVYVDNASPELVEIPAGLNVDVIQMGKNAGFAPATNTGIRSVPTGERDHVLLLNSDAYVGPDAIERMLRHLIRHPNVGAVGPLTDDGGVQSVVRFPHFKRTRGECRVEPVEMLTGFCCLKHGSAMQSVGLLDEKFPGGLGSDDDWCRRARRSGLKVLLAHDAFASHDHKSTFEALGLPREKWSRQAMKQFRRGG